jgi:Tol biopolymer transport system component
MLLPEGVNGFTTQLWNRVVVPYNGSLPEFRHVLHHELVHAFQYGIIFEQFGSSLISVAGTQMPFWFAEGLAEYLSSDWDNDADMFLMDAALNGRVPLPSPELHGYAAYKVGQSFIKFLAETRGPKTFTCFLLRFRQTKNVERSILDIYGKKADELGHEWLEMIKRLYWPEVEKRNYPGNEGISITNKNYDEGTFFIQPRLSPAGDLTACYSNFHDSPRIMIIDKTGKIKYEIGRMGFHFDVESLHPFRCGLAWSPDGNKLAFVASRNGVDNVRTIDTKRKKLLKPLLLPDVEEINSIDWSPDGNSIACAVVDSGQSDILIYDLQNNCYCKLTSDREYDSDPRYTSDGKCILFIRQDTISTNICSSGTILRPYTQLWKIDISGNGKKQLTKSPCNKKNLCLSHSGDSIIYVSDVNGINNLVIASLGAPDSAIHITDINGMAQGPDVSRGGNTIVYSHYQKGTWSVKKINRQKMSYPFLKPVTSTCWTISKSSGTQLYPVFHDSISDSMFNVVMSNKSAIDKKRKHKHYSTKADSVVSSSEKTVPYNVRFYPDYTGFSLGASSRYGIYGQASVSFSDLLGDHRFALMGDVKGNVQEYAHLYGIYLNQKHRLNFGCALYYSNEFTPRRLSPKDIYSDSYGGVRLSIKYPLLKICRFEFETNFEIRNRIPAGYNESDGYFRQDTDERIEMNSFSPALAFVYDDVMWAQTGPHSGTRAIIRTNCALPSKISKNSYYSADCDLRHYWHLGHGITWANRLVLGASHPMNNESNTRKFLLGGNENWLVTDYSHSYNSTGYRENIHSVPYSEVITPFRGWSYFELFGNHVAILNTELRFPIIDNISTPFPLPFYLKQINSAIFCDIGNAWNTSDTYKNLPLPDKIYGGVGFGLRANIGYFILKFDHAWKTDWKTFIGPTMDYVSIGSEF